ncbi:MAG: hypothetical protein ABIB97_05215 [Patescibacteria group bacterium]
MSKFERWSGVEGKEGTGIDDKAKDTTTTEVVEIESDIPKEVIERGDTSEIRSSRREKFAGHLEKAGPRTLIEYIKKGGIDLENVKGLRQEWKGIIERIKEKGGGIHWQNPKMYFLSKREAANMALEELQDRFARGQIKY